MGRLLLRHREIRAETGVNHKANGALYFAMRSTTEKNPKTKRLKIEILRFITLDDTALRREFC